MDQESWARLQQQHRPRVYGLCYRILGRAEDAEDACGETFVRAERSRDRYDPNRPFTQWIFSIAARVAIDRGRRRSLETRLFDSLEGAPKGWEPTEAAASPLETALARERQLSVRTAIAELAERDRAVLSMKYYADLSYDEIGEALGLSRAHVGTLIFRAKHRLRRRLASATNHGQRGYDQ